MRPRTMAVLFVILAALAAAFSVRTRAQSSLSIQYGANGLRQLSYKGVVLEDLSENSADAFHIWHMKATDLNGNLLSAGEYGWGENNNGRSWNPATHTWTYLFSWGSIATAYIQSGDALNIAITTTNAPNSGIILDGATIYPLALHFPALPAGFGAQSNPQIASNIAAPGLSLADYGAGEVLAAAADQKEALYSGWLPSGAANAYTALVSTTTPDGWAVFLPHADRPVLPGHSDTAVLSLRFAPSGTPLTTLAADLDRAWTQAWPSTLTWADRRIVGTVYLASSPQGDPSRAGGYPTNPRRWFNSPGVDVTTPSGLQAFQSRILQQAASNVQDLQRLGAQGAITWDIEGEAYPQPTSYACAPDQLAQLAPEMESAVQSPASPYNGMKLADAYFKTMRDAGFRIGLCVRPQHYTVAPDGTAQQDFLPAAQVYGELLRKMRYAHDRWGATLFYVDSSVDANGGTLDAGIFAQLAAQLPDSLLIPEESTAKHYAYTAPFLSFLFHGDLGTGPAVYSVYPGAFSVNLINDVDPVRLTNALPALTAAVRRGDILMVHADYWQANNPVVVQIYQAANAK